MKSDRMKSANLIPKYLNLLLVVCSLAWLPLASAGAGGERVIEHAQGVTRVPGTPQRVVTLFQGATDTAIALGITPAGVVDAWVPEGTFDYLEEPLQGVPHVGLETQPSLEAIALLQPDLIIASKRRHEKIYSQLSQIAPTVSLEMVFEFQETVELMGRALNREDQATELLRSWDGRLADFRQQIQAQLGDRWPLSATVLNIRADHVRIYLNGSYAGTVLHDLGFTRPAAHPDDHWVLKLTSKESIPVINADIVFYFMKDEPAVRANLAKWRDHPLWHTLDAARQGRIFPVDVVAWSLAGGILGANRMLDQLYEHFGLEQGS